MGSLAGTRQVTEGRLFPTQDETRLSGRFPACKSHVVKTPFSSLLCLSLLVQTNGLEMKGPCQDNTQPVPARSGAGHILLPVQPGAEHPNPVSAQLTAQT